MCGMSKASWESNTTGAGRVKRDTSTGRSLPSAAGMKCRKSLRATESPWCIASEAAMHRRLHMVAFKGRVMLPCQAPAKSYAFHQDSVPLMGLSQASCNACFDNVDNESSVRRN